MEKMKKGIHVHYQMILLMDMEVKLDYCPIIFESNELRDDEDS
jgi:hypothetical protein